MERMQAETGNAFERQAPPRVESAKFAAVPVGSMNRLPGEVLQLQLEG
jgi:hypothetical protein